VSRSPRASTSKPASRLGWVALALRGRSPAVHGITIMVNSLFNGWRFEDAWLGQSS
jgi:hypothetical protein